MRLFIGGLLALVLAAAPAYAEPTPTEPTEPTPTETTPTPSVVNEALPYVIGTARFERVLYARYGTWSETPAIRRLAWLRDGVPIPGAVATSFAPRAQDVGHRISLRESVTTADGAEASAESAAVTIGHVVDTRRTVTYSVRTKGKITTSLATFKQQVQETYDDPRGWRSNGIRFKQVSSGGSFTVVLAQASKVRSYSSACSATWSCRVGRNVIINQDRWKNASPAWRKSKGSLRDYRHMVVNHETGHWLGKGHVSCKKKRTKARVMQQQSKGLGGCTFNPWPTSGERYSPRFKF